MIGIIEFVLAATTLNAESGKISPELLNASGDVDVIVEYAPAARERGRGRTGQRVRRGDLASLAADPNVAYVHPDRKVYLTDFNGQLDYGWMSVTGITTKTGTLAYDGTGIGVAVIDSGILVNADFRDAAGVSRVVYKESFVPGDSSIGDTNGHGTHVAGIIGSRGKLSTCPDCFYRVRGVAPNVKLISLRVLDGNGVGTDSGVINAIDRAIALKSTYNIRVINLSVGRPVTVSYTQDPLCQAVQRAWQAGIVVVVAAGNEGRNNLNGTSGYGLITSPGNSPYAITVGAANTLGTMSRTDDKMASYSSKGPTLIDRVAKPDLVAPGNAILSNRAYDVGLETTFPLNIVPTTAYSLTSYQADHFQLSGTSMAAPLVSGAAALLLQKTPSLTPDQVKARLMKTAWKGMPSASTAVDPVSGAVFNLSNDIFTVGAGYLDIPAALASTDLASGSALSPTVSFDSSNNTVSLMLGTNVVWGTNVTWGTNVVWGTAVSASNVVWGTGVVWASNGSTAGTNVIWGTNVSWGTNVVWGTSGVAGEATNITINGDR